MIIPMTMHMKNLIEITEYIFNAFNGQYLKVAIEKRIVSLRDVELLLDRYIIFME